MRFLSLGVLCLALGGFRSHSVASTVTSASAPVGAGRDDTTKPLPPDRAQKAVENLLQPGLTDAQLNAQIEALGRYQDSPVAARALLNWLLYYPPWCAPSGHNFEYVGVAITDRPAVRGLIAMGEFAAPFLVEHEITLYTKVRVRDPLRREKESRYVRYIVGQSSRVAARAVDSALQRIADAPQNAELRAACIDFIRQTVSRYDEPERSKLFPPFALSLKQ